MNTKGVFIRCGQFGQVLPWRPAWNVEDHERIMDNLGVEMRRIINLAELPVQIDAMQLPLWKLLQMAEEEDSCIDDEIQLCCYKRQRQ